MFARVLVGSLSQRRSQVATAVVAVVLGAALVSALVNLSFDVGGQAGRELAVYGAKILVLPDKGSLGLGSALEERGLPVRHLALLDGMPGVVGFAPYLYMLGEVEGETLVVGGVDFDQLKMLNPAWSITGHWPVGPGEVLVGINTARLLSLAPGGSVTIGRRGTRHAFVVAGLIETGAAEDSQLLLPLPTAQMIASRPEEITVVQVAAATSEQSVEEIAAEIERRLPGVQARTLRQFSLAEQRVLGRVTLLLGLVAGAVAVVAVLAVAGTMLTSVLQRRVEIGLMKALGAPDLRVAAIFLAEAIGIGAAGGILGYGAGLVIAALIGQTVFHASVKPNPLGIPATLGLALSVAVLGSLLPVRRGMAIDPAVTLRGE